MDNPNDKVYTSPNIVDEVLDLFLPQVGANETILEPFRGTGAFYDRLPQSRREWCEIDAGRDYMEHVGRYDWIITNPPYSIFADLLPKMLRDADNLLLLIPINKLLSSMPRLMDIKNAGAGIRRIHFLGSGRQLKFPFGFPVGVVHIQRGHSGQTEISYAERCGQAKRKTRKN